MPSDGSISDTVMPFGYKNGSTTVIVLLMSSKCPSAGFGKQVWRLVSHASRAQQQQQDDAG
jgi:hypothetical protein